MTELGQGNGSAAPSSDQRGYHKGRRRRAEILRAALAAFGTLGYRNASMTQIAAECGVTRAGLVHHFATKEALLQAVLAERDSVNGEMFFAGSDPAADGVGFLARLVRVAEHNAHQQGVVALYAVVSAEATDPSHPAHEYFVARYQTLREAIATAFRQAAASGAVRAGARIDGLDAELIALMDGLQVQWLLADGELDMAGRLRARLADILTVPV